MLEALVTPLKRGGFVEEESPPFKKKFFNHYTQHVSKIGFWRPSAAAAFESALLRIREGRWTFLMIPQHPTYSSWTVSTLASPDSNSGRLLA